MSDDGLVTICHHCQRPCSGAHTHRGEPIHPWCLSEVRAHGD